MNLLCICIVFLLLFGYNIPISYTKVRIKPKNLLKTSLSFDFYAFTSRYLWIKIVLLWTRACVAYECLFSGLCYICNMCTQVADRYIMLILRKWSNSDKDINNKQKRAVYQSCALLYFLLLYTCRYKHTEFFLFNSKESICHYKYLSPH